MVAATLFPLRHGERGMTLTEPYFFAAVVGCDVCGARLRAHQKLSDGIVLYERRPGWKALAREPQDAGALARLGLSRLRDAARRRQIAARDVEPRGVAAQ
jgi:hypothetical protein